MASVYSARWAPVLDLQRAASLSAVGPRTFGSEEALEVVLDGIRRRGVDGASFATCARTAPARIAVGDG